jgi:hypothetical protein
MICAGLLSVILLNSGCHGGQDIKQFSEIGNGLAKGITQLGKEQGIKTTGFASDRDKKIFKVRIGIDHTKITSEQLKQVVESYLKNAASFTTQPDPEIMLKPYNLKIEEIDKENKPTSIIAEKTSGSTQIIWKQ